MTKPKVIHRNEDWQVEENGLLEYHHDGYWVHPDSIADTRKVGDTVFFNLPIHMAGKNWFDPRTFLPAWLAALKVVDPDYDQAMAHATAVYAYDLKVDDLEYERDWLRWEYETDGPEREAGPMGFKLLKMSDFEQFDAWREAHPHGGTPKAP